MKKKVFNYLSNSIIAKVYLFIIYRFKEFESSSSYWETRYQKNGNSGRGSYGESANFKASVINNFVEKHNIQFVDDFGCGDGNQLSLSNYPNYVGYDISETILENVRNKFKNDNSKIFFNILDYSKSNSKLQLALSLDVIYHLVEDQIFASHMNQLFDGYMYVIIFSTNFNETFYNGSHVKHRKFSDWIEKNTSNYELVQVIYNIDIFSKVNFYIYKKINF